jgi:hypothetical protein
MRRTLHVDTADAVVWIISSNIVRTRTSADIIVLSEVRSIPRRWLAGGEAEAAEELSSHGIAVVVVEQSIDVSAVVETTSKCIK